MSEDQVNPVCNNCVFMDVVILPGRSPLFYCNNENSPRGDEVVGQSDSCNLHEFDDEEVAR